MHWVFLEKFEKTVASTIHLIVKREQKVRNELVWVLFRISENEYAIFI